MSAPDFILSSFTGVAKRKLAELLERGFKQCGVMIAHQSEDGSVKRGAVSEGGQVIWWPADDRPLRMPRREEIREVFMAHGFTIKEGQTDLKQYVYDAAHALLKLAAFERQGVPEGPAAWIDPRDLKILRLYSGQCQVVLFTKPGGKRIALYADLPAPEAPAEPAQPAAQAASIAQEAHGYVREGMTPWDRENLHDAIDKLAAMAQPEQQRKPT